MTRSGMRWGSVVMGVMLFALYVFLYAPVLYVIFASFSADIVWPFPPAFSAMSYEDLFASSLYGDALANSLILGIGSAVLSTLQATGGAIGILRYRARWRGLALLLFLAPLFYLSQVHLKWRGQSGIHIRGHARVVTRGVTYAAQDVNGAFGSGHRAALGANRPPPRNVDKPARNGSSHSKRSQVWLCERA